MTDLGRSREFLGVPVEGGMWYERPSVRQRDIEELLPYFKEAFANGLKAVTWNQYTPYFNDGDTCEFGVGDPGFTTNSDVALAWLSGEDSYENENGEDHDCSHWDYELPWSDNYPHPDGIKKGQFDVPISTYEFQYALREKFGDHTTVVVGIDKDGNTRVVQNEYEHD